jgi:hypothetical protein
MSIPLTLSPFFQEYKLADLNPRTDSHTIIERVLQFGNRAEIRWLFETYQRREITEWVKRFGSEKLPEPHRTFWRIILEIQP